MLEVRKMVDHNKSSSIREADEVILEINVLIPYDEDLLRSFLKRLKWWLIERHAPIEEGDKLVIPADILREADTSTYYSWEKPIAQVKCTRPKGEVWIGANSSVRVNFNPSSPQGSPQRMPSPMLEGKSQEVFQRWLERIKNMSLDEYMHLSEEEKKKVIEEYVEWRLHASGYK
jgi:hypothetical protein